MLVVEHQHGRLSQDSCRRDTRNNNLREIGTAHRPLSTIDGIGSNETLSTLDFKNDVRLTFLHFGKGSLVGRFLARKDEITGGLNSMHKPLRLGSTIVVDHRHSDVLHLHAHHPRHDTHDDDGEQDDETGQKTVAPYLEKLLLYEIVKSHELIPIECYTF